MTMTVYVSVMVTVMLQTGRSSVPLPGIRVARVQRMHLLQMMVVIDRERGPSDCAFSCWHSRRKTRRICRN